MDPLTTEALAATLTALVSGAAGEAGKTTWTSLTAFVRSRFSRDSEPVSAMTALEQAPSDPTNADRLAVALQNLAQTDQTSAAWLNPWLDDARAISQTTTHVRNNIGGQAQVHGPVIQGHSFGDIHFG